MNIVHAWSICRKNRCGNFGRAGTGSNFVIINVFAVRRHMINMAE